MPGSLNQPFAEPVVAKIRYYMCAASAVFILFLIFIAAHPCKRHCRYPSIDDALVTGDAACKHGSRRAMAYQPLASGVS